MSYNISNWKNKKIENLVLKLKDFYKIENSELNPETELIDIDKVCISGGAEGFEIIGILNNDKVYVEDITLYGERSNRFYYEVLLPALKNSTGRLEVLQVWESGDTICNLSVNDGECIEENI